MGESLREQLLKAGLVDRQKAKQVEADRRKQERQQNKGRPAEDEAQVRARQARAEQAERDRKLNQERQQAAERRALLAQARQLIEHHRVLKRDGDMAYQFQDGKRIKKIYVDPLIHQQLVTGNLVVARYKERYELIPAAVGERVRERDPGSLPKRAESQAVLAPDDAYAAYQVPDDLMW